MKAKLTLILCLLASARCLPAFAQAPAASGTILTIAGNGASGFSGDGGLATNATLNGPFGLAIGPDGTLYFADNSNFRIRAISPATGIIRTIAGNGTFGDTGNDGPATNAASPVTPAPASSASVSAATAARPRLRK
jgi:DNA-binding beta-propeller fold protein YncE